MPITLTPYKCEKLCVGFNWEINDEVLLAELVSLILVGRYLHVQKIFSGKDPKSTKYRKAAINDAIRKLTVEPGADPWHRDGLIFQILSWIAANMSSGENSIIAAPHIIPAHKGFDGLQIEISDSEQSVSAVVIFEDKATTNPRKTIRELVWPEFNELHSGKRESELMQEVTGLLSTRRDLVADVDEVIEDIIWDKAKQYRLSITANSPSQLENPAKKRLFKGYDSIIDVADAQSRMANVVYIENLRYWMESFSSLVIETLEENAKNV